MLLASRRWRWLVLALAVAAALSLVLVARARARFAGRAVARASSGTVTELHVPHASGPIVIDGELEEPAWQASVAQTGALTDSAGRAVHPYSDARFTWDERNLYVLLYAADEDLEAKDTASDGPVWLEDSFHLFIGNGDEEESFDISPRAVLADGKRSATGDAPGAARPFDYTWNSDAKIGVDTDGTLDDPSDDDEEWVIEAAIPFASLGIQPVPGVRFSLRVHRCDTPKKGGRVCGAWGEGPPPGEVVLDP